MSSLYTNARQLLLTGAINWTTQTFGVLLVTNAYTPNFAAHQFVTDIPSGAISARIALTSLTAVNGGAHAANASVSSVVGAAILYMVLYRNTGTDATSPLICLIDAASGLPVFPSGTPVTISWDATNGIFVV